MKNRNNLIIRFSGGRDGMILHYDNIRVLGSGMSRERFGQKELVDEETDRWERT